MIMYHDNGKPTTYLGNRKIEELVKFVQGYADSPSAKSEEPRAVSNSGGEVLVLNPETFAAIRSGGAMFVKFFAPWCGHCKKLAPAWKQLARHMQSKLTIAEVNCDEHGMFCKSHNIQGYPTLLYFPEEGQSIEYTGVRKVEQLKVFAENATAAYVVGAPFHGRKFHCFCQWSQRYSTRTARHSCCRTRCPLPSSSSCF